MDDKTKKLVISLSASLEKNAWQFIADKYHSESEFVSITEMINLVMSAHMSSLFSIMSKLSEHDEIVTRAVNMFIKKMIEDLRKQDSINNVEMLHKR
jgi:hypothetical protein